VISSVVEITALKGVDARFEPAAWDFAEERQADIADLWAKAIADKPKMFDGKVLLQHRWSIVDGVYHAGYSTVQYSSFVAWPQLGKPGQPRRNGFAMAALEAADGAFLLGVMGPHTFNAGKTYFPAGTPDMDDLTADGMVDLAGSLVRELKEETGLRDGEFTVADDWTLVVDGHRAAFMKPARMRLPAAEARELILSRFATAADQELSDIAIVRDRRDVLNPAIPDFARAYMFSVFNAR
jgi:8-oxo-dGTP pyrophosphatase MutT (NUDIX family)